MRITFDVNLNISSETLKEVLQIVKAINQKLNTMPTKAEFEQALAEVGTALDNIAADITRLTDQLSGGGLTDAEEQEIFTQLRAVADRAKAIADTTPEPTDPEPQP
jgi:hypothetical protein